MWRFVTLIGITRIFSLTKLQRFGISVGGVIITAALRLALNPILGEDLPLFLFVFPIILAGWCGGLWPGIVATVLSLVMGDYLFLLPRGSVFHYEGRLNLTREFALAFAGISFSLLFEWTQRALKAQLESLQRTQQIINVSPGLIYIYDLRQKKNIFVNPTIATALGYTFGQDSQRAELMTSIMHADDRQPFAEHLDRVTTLREGETIDIEFRLRDSSGTWHWFHSSEKVFSRSEDGGVQEIIGTASDITDRKRLENESRFMDDLNQALLPLADPVEIMSVAVRMLGQYLDVDRCGYAEVERDRGQFSIMGNYTREGTSSIVGCYEISEFGAQEQAVLLENRPFVVNDIDAEAPPEADLSAYKRGQIRSMVCIPLAKGGSFVARMAVQQSTPRYWTNGEVELVTTVANRCWEAVERARALRKRKEAEAEHIRLLEDIEAERNRLKQILEQLPIGVAIAEAPSGRMVFHNLEAARLLRHPLLNSEDYKGYGQYGALHEDGTSYAAEEYPMARSLLANEIIKNEEMRYRRGDGTETVFSVDAAPIHDASGRVVLCVVTFIDIAERKLADSALRESEERFAKAFQASPDAMVISRISDGRPLEVNDSFVKLSGYSRDELIQQSALLPNLYVNPTDRARAVALLKEQNCVRDLELQMKRKSGEIRLILFSAEPLELRGEHCWLTIGRDITEHRLAEEERERLLMQEKGAREEAEAANRMKDEFLATISHELRTPLTAIVGWARMLSSGTLSESQSQHALEVIAQSAKSQTQLVDDILDASRMITGRFKLDAQPLEIARVFKAAIEVIRPTAEAKRITLRAVTDDRNSIVRGDANRLQQVIWNLLSNAVKFTNEGGNVEARLTRAGTEVEISVTDTGIGIEPSFMPYIFDRFRQADSTSTRRYGGLGLGLAIVRHVVEMHGGSISASSLGKGRGATFKVRFPAASLARLQQQSAKQPDFDLKPIAESSREEQPKKLTGVRVLLVEDDPDTLELLSFVLAQTGADVITAASASEALNALERMRPDILVSDLAMPDQDGYELMLKVRSRGRGQAVHIPAIALSSYSRPEDRARAIAAGFQVHVPKPVDPERFVSVVASLSGRSES